MTAKKQQKKVTEITPKQQLYNVGIKDTPWWPMQVMAFTPHQAIWTYYQHHQQSVEEAPPNSKFQVYLEIIIPETGGIKRIVIMEVMVSKLVALIKQIHHQVFLDLIEKTEKGDLTGWPEYQKEKRNEKR
jgi:hypothetical protein